MHSLQQAAGGFLCLKLLEIDRTTNQICGQAVGTAVRLTAHRTVCDAVAREARREAGLQSAFDSLSAVPAPL